MPYLDIIILALIAGFVLLRLRAVLGQKIGHDAQPYTPPRRRPGDDSPIVKIPDAMRIGREPKDPDAALLEQGDAALKEGIAAIKTADSEFTLTDFLAGARGAFEMVFDAFSKQDKSSLETLLSPSLYTVFTGEIDKRGREDITTDTTLVAILSQTATEASIEKNIARIRVRFVSEQVSVRRDKSGRIVEGDPAATEQVEDVWLFERDVTSRNPNWKIIET